MNQERKQSQTNNTTNNTPLSQLSQERATKSNAIEIPTISLPKGGGAIKGIDEKFQVNPVNGTSSFSIPLPLSPNRNGFTPQMSLSYNSGVGNGLFGMGWDIDLPSIQRRTDKKLPRYFDTNNTEGVAKEDSFMFSGVEELVPYMDLKNDKWEIRQKTIGDFTIRQYRPRIEGSFSRIERIYQKSTDAYYWRVTSNGNITTFFGYTEGCRIADPTDRTKVFQWVPEFSFDEKGSWVWYDYKAESLAGVKNGVHEKNRFNGNAPFSQKHLKSIKYGNQTAFYADPNQPFVPQLPINQNYFFQLVFDYGEHHATNPKPNDNGIWADRKDPFSTNRACFEMRTYRLCQRVLMFHTFPNEANGNNRLNNGEPTLVRAINFEYKYSTIYDGKVVANAEVTYLKAIEQTGYIKNSNEGYKEKSLPKMTFEYQKLTWNKDIQTVSTENLVHAPVGLSGNYQWTDLYNEGINGILTEQANGWFYKSNLGQVQADSDDLGELHFSHAQPVMPKPSFMGLSNGVLQLQDLDANGEKQLVVNTEGVQGYFELTDEGEWQPFKSFLKTLNLDLRDPNVRMLDVNGDGKPEVVLSDAGAFWFWENQGKIGYDAPELATKPYDEEQGAAIVFSDFEQRIFLADMSGDGLMDIVRIRNGEVCYWANMGYGRFSAKVTMSNSPVFDHPEMFNPSYIQLADISGTGATDIIYLGRNKFKAYLNCCGNRWADAEEIDPFFPTEQPNRITITDLLGNGTACIVWSSEMPAYQTSPMRYMDLTGGKKPHIMISHENGFGKKTVVEYKSSTYFYLKDKLAGTPWITKLPFPVQCVSKTVITEGVTNVRFAAEYSYHHGYYDHAEREFRGFGRVDQTDTEAFEIIEKIDAINTVTKEHYQPPILTKTWFHTGAFIGQDRIFKQYEKEYWYNIANKPEFNDDVLHDAFIDFPDSIKNLTAVEAREAARACKGMTLRQEIFSIDGSDKEKIPYTVATHTCFIRPLQPRLDNQYAVFIALESEAISFSYERASDDARVAHSMNLEIDQYAQVKKAVSIVYGRASNKQSLLKPYNFTGSEAFQDKHQGILNSEQNKTHVILTETDFTINDLTTDAAFYRLPLPYQVKTFECQGADFNKQNRLFTKEEIETALNGLVEKPYETAADVKGKRLIEHIQTLYRSNDLKIPLPLGEVASLAMPWEAYQLAFTPEILRGVYGDKLPDNTTNDLDNIVLGNGKFEKIDNQNYWISSGKPIFIELGRDLAQVKSEFYQPIAFEDPFEIKTHVELGDYTLFIKTATDALGNQTSVEAFDYRTLSPVKMKDINDNFSEVVTDALGMVVATAIYGKNGEGDTLAGGDWDFTPARINAFFAKPHDEAVGLLHNATACMIYDLNTEGGTKPSRVASIVRETHFSALKAGEKTKYQISIEYSDGLGNVALKKVQAEGGKAFHVDKNATGECQKTEVTVNKRWIGNGRTILNNKGKPVKQYEPYFSDTPQYENEDCVRLIGVTPILYYDAIGRNIKTELPDKTFTKVEFDAWEQRSFDPNDTVKESEWYKNRLNRLIDIELTAQGKDPIKEQQAATKAALHDNTPSVVYLDSLGRPFFSLEHNIVSGQPQFYPTYVTLDIEGNVHKIIDARNNTVMEYKYDMLGHRVYQVGMDNGERWLFNDCMGKPLYAWDENGVEGVLPREVREMRTKYDDLHRPIDAFLKIKEETYLIEHIEYGESVVNPENLNLCGQMILHQDGSGQIENKRFDFKGNLLETHKQILKEHDLPIVDWNTAQLENTVYKLLTEYDALNRMTKLYNWHRGNINDAALYKPTYSERGVLVSENLTIKGTTTTVVRNIEYDPKGQRTRMQQGDKNGGVLTTTSYQYDIETFRLLKLRTTRHSDSKELQNLNYTYDPVGNILEIQDIAQDTVFFRNQLVKPENIYEYDALYRLISAKGREQPRPAPQPKDVDWGTVPSFPVTGITLQIYTQTYIYDAVGNIKEMRHSAPISPWTRTYKYADKNNRLLSTDTDNLPTSVTYRYDIHGNMLNMHKTGEDLITWDYRDMIQQYDLQGGGTAYYQYGNDKQRSRKVIEKQGGIKEERLYLGGMERYRRWNGLVLEEEIETHHLFDGEQRILMVEDVKISNPPIGGREKLPVAVLYRYQYSNHLGSASLELNEQGDIITYEEYHPYGTTAYQAKNADIKCAAKRYRYTGMERDEESGLAYHTARYYLPWLGRWGSADPIGVEGGMNLYLYSSCNPINLIDNNGKDPKPLFDVKGSGDVAKSPMNLAVSKSIFEKLYPSIPPNTTQWASKSNFPSIFPPYNFGKFTLTDSTTDLDAKTGRNLQNPDIVKQFSYSSWRSILFDSSKFTLKATYGSILFGADGGLSTPIGNNSLHITNGSTYSLSLGLGDKVDKSFKFPLFDGRINSGDSNRAISIFYGRASYSHGEANTFSPLNKSNEGVAFMGLNTPWFSLHTYNDVSMLGGPGTDHLWTAGGGIEIPIKKYRLGINYDDFTGRFRGRNERYDCPQSPDGCYIQDQSQVRLNRTEWSITMDSERFQVSATLLLGPNFNGQHLIHGRAPGFLSIAKDSAEFSYDHERKGQTGAMINIRWRF